MQGRNGVSCQISFWQEHNLFQMRQRPLILQDKDLLFCKTQISTSGALTTSLLGVIIPSVMELLIEGNNSKWLSIKNYLLISVGVFAFLLGTSISVLELYQSIKTTTQSKNKFTRGHKKTKDLKAFKYIYFDKYHDLLFYNCYFCDELFMFLVKNT